MLHQRFGSKAEFRLVNAEANLLTDRLEYLYTSHLVTMERVIRPLVDALSSAGLIRPVPWRSLFLVFTAGGTAKFSNEALARLVDPGHVEASVDVETHADFVADLVIAGLCVPG
ncbi:hypothetical protein ACIQM4_25270 [Streptomyces sp. NPDC091272]|uniref:hypothetical protein n=1 Tax=Streptomyces sp. NPDC091272 TaxID=3365981 RepID=UPI00381D4414